MGGGPDDFPWSTLLVNASGCVLIGVLMVLVTEVTEPHRLVRPFLAVGFLGGFTTFSTFGLDVQSLLLAGRPAAATASRRHRVGHTRRNLARHHDDPHHDQTPRVDPIRRQ
jgi:fluoride ion exporter CrcB/FEX